jgi:hypothetical protein
MGSELGRKEYNRETETEGQGDREGEIWAGSDPGNGFPSEYGNRQFRSDATADAHPSIKNIL